ncbi:hypothetical protein EVAR_33554_1 [Eumeta japonica]|uniref:Uncharacterized protein n=1 Tax=Eumeta variegata TaxID=151549 RepID=A0A4C1VJP4_EUMVA|nr:hypothetical protein EVAR_33554_1 [Eumeta japonica]
MHVRLVGVFAPCGRCPVTVRPDGHGVHKTIPRPLLNFMEKCELVETIIYEKLENKRIKLTPNAVGNARSRRPDGAQTRERIVPCRDSAAGGTARRATQKMLSESSATREAGNALLTSQGLRVTMGGDDRLLFGGSQAR